MADPVTTLTASAIATLAFQEFIKSGAGELAKETISKMSELRQKISDRLRGKHEMAEESLQKATAGNEQAINTVATLLGVEMLNPEFAAEIQAIAQEINVSILRDSSSMFQQTNHPDSVGIQIRDSKGGNFGIIHNYGQSRKSEEQQ